MSNLGIFHTIIGCVAVVFGGYDFFKKGKIDVTGKAGKFYVILTILTCLTTFGLFRTGKPSVGHIISVATLLAVFGSHFLKGVLLQTFCLTSSFYLSMIPTTVEILTRLPVGAPLATGVEDPIVKGALGVLTLFYVAGAVYQLRKMKQN